jgi:V/A-type H+-transporting ATPase subunit D
MGRYEVAPTRTNLLKLKSDLSFAYEGYGLLEQKREILVTELKRFIARGLEAQKKVDEELSKAFDALREAQLASGVAAVTSASRAVNVQPEVNLRERRVMGVAIPAATLDLNENMPYYGPQSTSVWTDEVVVRFKSALTAIAGLAESRISIIRLASEIQKTIRRVNALEKIYIPDHEETVKYVEDSLEELDREHFFILKLIKDSLEARRK